MYKICKGLIISSLLISFIADAGLIRGAGRGGITVSFGTIDLLVPTSEINEFGLLNWDYYSNINPAVPYDSVYVPPGYPMAMAVPDFCFVSLGSGQPFEDDPCYWQFNEGERLEVIGSTVSFFSLAIQNITWRIFESDADPFIDAPLFEFDNRFSSVENTGDRSQRRQLYLDAAMPEDLAPGEYQVQVAVTQTAPLGYTFYAADAIFYDEACFGEPENIICSRLGSVSGNTFVRSGIDRMVVVSEPGIVLIILTALCCLLVRRKVQTK
ncbi:MAG: hypothetical protein NWQ54_11010 [Paraglaciecola sp.]|nr:hypothetical protein [Paraglaciecola sp.]